MSHATLIAAGLLLPTWILLEAGVAPIAATLIVAGSAMAVAALIVVVIAVTGVRLKSIWHEVRAAIRQLLR